jgi:hypothetical protein
VVTLVLLIDGVGGWFGVALVSILGVSLVIGARAAGFLRAEEDQVGDSAGG